MATSRSVVPSSQFAHDKGPGRHNPRQIPIQGPRDVASGKVKTRFRAQKILA